MNGFKTILPVLAESIPFGNWWNRCHLVIGGIDESSMKCLPDISYTAQQNLQRITQHLYLIRHFATQFVFRRSTPPSQIAINIGVQPNSRCTCIIIIYNIQNRIGVTCLALLVYSRATILLQYRLTLYMFQSLILYTY